MDAVPPQLPDRAQARAWLLTNLLVLPGLGSVMAGRQCGWLQMAMALSGFGLTAWWIITFSLEWLREQALPGNGGPHLVAGLLGVLLFLIAWTWALTTGWCVLRRAL